MFQRALAIREQKWGTEHPATAISVHGLAELYRQQGKYEQAEPIYQRALAIRQRQLGPTHPDTMEAHKAYVAFLRLLGRDEEADAMEADAKT